MIVELAVPLRGKRVGNKHVELKLDTDTGRVVVKMPWYVGVPTVNIADLKRVVDRLHDDCSLFDDDYNSRDRK